MQCVFSGIQPSGIIHIGNYLGALRQFVQLQQTHSPTLYCIMDMHAITATSMAPEELRQRVRCVAAAYLACGLDPSKSIIFAQSANAYHARLAWILSCVARIGWLSRMTQFKDKAGKNAQNASVGLYIYPILMAADILLYRAVHVPVGEDQKQHLELARDIAQKFNNDFGKFFPLPEPLILEQACRIYSLRDGRKKMSKSDASPYSYISLNDDDDTIVDKIRKARTDTLPFPQVGEDLTQRPEVANLITIATAFSPHMSLAPFAGGSLATFKKALIALLIAHIKPIRERMQAFLRDTAHLDTLLAEGAQRAREIARPIYADIAQYVGFADETVSA